MRWAVTAAILLTSLLAGAGSAQAPAVAGPDPQPVTLADGRKLALYCQGAGSPAVILDAGLGMSGGVWSRVQADLARSARTCAFDRPGYGRSDAGPLPRDAARNVADLREALTQAGIAGPYVLVGHSMAGFNMRLFATLHRSEVAGMVLVDPSLDGNEAPLRAASPTFVRVQSELDAVAGRCIRAAAAGEMRPGNEVYAQCGSPPVGSPMASATMAQAVLSEQENLDESSRQVAAREHSYGALPLIVLTAGAPYAPGAEYAPGAVWPEAERAALQSIVSADHARMAARSTRGVHRVVAGATHVIHRSRPEAVTAAVREVIDAGR